MFRSSLELFAELQPKFREIEWHQDGFTTESEPTVLDNWILRNESLLLVPGHLEPKKPIPDDWWMDKNCGKDLRPMFNPRKGGLAFDFRFNPSNKKVLIGQMEEAVLRALRNGPFKGRQFFMDPEFGDWKRSNPSQMSRLDTSIPVVFSHTGDAIPGLYLGEVIALNWKFFIPENTQESKIIQIVLDLEEARAEQKKYHQRDPHRDSVEDLQKRFEGLLPAVAP